MTQKLLLGYVLQGFFYFLIRCQEPHPEVLRAERTRTAPAGNQHSLVLIITVPLVPKVLCNS